MSKSGFAVRCPNCGRWSVWSLHPTEVTVHSKHEFLQIMTSFRKLGAEGFFHPKLLRCSSPRWICPSSFEAFVFDDEKLALRCLDHVKKSWVVTRDFRLYRADHTSRWVEPGRKNYFGIMFCTQPVPRLRNLDIDSLMDREIIRRLLVGISVEIETPLTIYAANIYGPETKKVSVYWIPTEPYFKEGASVPHGYNLFCECCRNIILRKLDDQFQQDISA